MRRGEEGLRHSLPPLGTLSLSLSLCSVVCIVSVSDFMEKVQLACSLRDGWHLDEQSVLDLSCEGDQGAGRQKQV